MAISKEKLREMRENSRLGAAKQHAKEQAALDKYMYRRNTEVANMLSTNEKIALVAQEKRKGLSNQQIANKHNIPLGSVSNYVTKARAQGLLNQPSGVIDAAELSNEEREELTAQAEADAGIVPECTENAQERTENAACVDVGDTLEPSDIFDIAKGLMMALRKAMDTPDNVRVDFQIIEGLCELTVCDRAKGNNTAFLTWRL